MRTGSSAARVTSVLLPLLAASSGCALMKGKPKAPAGPVFEKLPPKERKVHAPAGVELFTRSVGYGPPVLVIPPGPGSAQEIVSFDLEPYTESVRWTYFDPPGTGRSSTPGTDDGFSLDAHVADLEAIRTTLQAPKIDVIAFGFGATWAVAWAARHPASVDHLMLINPIVSAGQIERAEQIRASRINDADKHALAELEKSGLKKKAPEQYREKKVALAVSIGTCKREGPQPRGRSDEHKDTARKVLAALGPTFDLTGDGEKITAKTAILMGRCGYLSQISAEELKNKVKDSQLVVLEDSGMYPYVEEKDRFETILRTFFGSPPKPAAEPGKGGKPGAKGKGKGQGEEGAPVVIDNDEVQALPNPDKE